MSFTLVAPSSLRSASHSLEQPKSNSNKMSATETLTVVVQVFWAIVGEPHRRPLWRKDRSSPPGSVQPLRAIAATHTGVELGTMCPGRSRVGCTTGDRCNPRSSRTPRAVVFCGEWIVVANHLVSRCNRRCMSRSRWWLWIVVASFWIGASEPRTKANLHHVLADEFTTRSQDHAVRGHGGPSPRRQMPSPKVVDGESVTTVSHTNGLFKGAGVAVRTSSTTTAPSRSVKAHVVSPG